MLKLRHTHPTAFLLLVCYLAALLLWLVAHLGGFIVNRVYQANGTLPTRQLQPADFELHDMIERDGQLITTGSDPQMRLRDTALRAANVRVELCYAQAPWAATAFWAAPGAGHRVQNMVHAQKGEGSLLFLLPAAGGQSLRLDLDTKPGNVISITGITVNVPGHTARLFIPSSYEVAGFLVLPALVACGLSLIPRKTFRRGAKAGGPHG